MIYYIVVDLILRVTIYEFHNVCVFVLVVDVFVRHIQAHARRTYRDK